MGGRFPLQDDDAEDAQDLPERMVLIAKRWLDNPLMILVVLVAISLVLAAVLWVIIYNGYEEGLALDETDVMDIREMDTFTNTAYQVYQLREGQEEQLYMELFHALWLPPDEGDMTICFIESITVTASWNDETGGGQGLVPYENQPDTVGVSLLDLTDGIFDESMEGTNPPDETGYAQVSWDGSGHFIESSWLNQGDLTFLKVDGSAYLDVRGGVVQWDGDTDARVWLTEAGDMYHPFLPLQESDGGNEVIVEVEISGYCITLGPNDYDEVVSA